MAYDTPENVVPTSKAMTRLRVDPVYGWRIFKGDAMLGSSGVNEIALANEGEKRRKKMQASCLAQIRFV